MISNLVRSVLMYKQSLTRMLLEESIFWIELILVTHDNKDSGETGVPNSDSLSEPFFKNIESFFKLVFMHVFPKC